jgi:hypothetical protein
MSFKWDYKSKELLHDIFERGLSSVFPNITVALRIFVSLPASVVSGERTSNLLKQVKDYYNLTMGQDRLNGFATLQIGCGLTRKLYFSQ